MVSKFHRKIVDLKVVKLFMEKLLKNGLPSVKYFLGEGGDSLTIRQESPQTAGNAWDSYLASIVEEIRQAPKGFLRQPVISRTVHPNQQDLARLYLEEMTKDVFSRTKILPKLHDIPFGDPFLCSFFPFTSPMTLQHAYYMSMMKKHLNLFLPENRVQHVLEVGGGYGNLCRLTYEFGYDGNYVIADLPKMNGMQRLYLSHALPEKILMNHISFCSLQDAKILPDKAKAALIATFSLSEMPLETRRTFEPYYKHFDYLFIAYNRAFDGVDNCDYFNGLSEDLKGNFNILQIKDRHRSVWFLLCERLHSLVP